jgi:hypothetical protein
MGSDGTRVGRPQPPRMPEAAECCQSGCDPCVFDRYAEAYEKYALALAAWVAMEEKPARDDAS